MSVTLRHKDKQAFPMVNFKQHKLYSEYCKVRTMTILFGTHKDTHRSTDTHGHTHTLTLTLTLTQRETETERDSDREGERETPKAERQTSILVWAKSRGGKQAREIKGLSPLAGPRTKSLLVQSSVTAGHKIRNSENNDGLRFFPTNERYSIALALTSVSRVGPISTNPDLNYLNRM